VDLKSSDDLLTIGELARRTGQRPSALRYYDEIGLLKPSARMSGQRRYDSDAVHLLGLIALCQEVGFTLRDTRALLAPGSRARWETMARGKLAELDEAIRKAHAAKRLLDETLRCQCTRLEGCQLVAEAGARRRHRRNAA
jgi:MerR family transcriptional regulator, redox-sensitive transcriptional activator SoxR